MSTPYVGTNDYGILTMRQEQIYDAVDDAHSHDFQVGIHANGDVTIDYVLKASSGRCRSGPTPTADTASSSARWSTRSSSAASSTATPAG